jgi:phosphate starvation-inducible PhoH-like protein
MAARLGSEEHGLLGPKKSNHRKKQYIKRNNNNNNNNNNNKQTIREGMDDYMFSKLDMERVGEEKEESTTGPLFSGGFRYLAPREKASLQSRFSVPKNASQGLFVALLQNASKKIVFASGPAGTGKTLLAVEQGIYGFITGLYERLVITRPTVTVDEDLGYLPGTLEEKMAPYLRPIFDILSPFFLAKEVQQLVEEKIIEIAPLGMMRGRTFKHCYVVADEMQNSTVAQMKMLLTRLGEGSRMVVLGDLEQQDNRGYNKAVFGGGGGGGGGGEQNNNGLQDILQRIAVSLPPSMGQVRFGKGDVEREMVVQDVLDLYD